jgi:hypothetical protein
MNLLVSGSYRVSCTARSLGEPRRTLDQSVIAALKARKVRQAGERLRAGPLWQDHGLVFTSAVGTPLDAHNVPRTFR